MDQVQNNTGRFAPSPTGDLHFGSLIAALASFLQARKSQGRWLVRIEDIDPPRAVAGSANSILHTLILLGMRPDGSILYQSQRIEAYKAAIDRLLQQDQAYWCGCSRRDLPSSGIYPGTCANGLPPGKLPRSIRLRVRGTCIRFTDLIRGNIEEHLEQSVGDFVIQRADGLVAYQLAVVVDDAHQGITEVVRGADLLDSTARQIYLQQCLGFTTPKYAHHPVVTDQQGHKLSKRQGSDPVSDLPAADAINLALEFLGQSPPSAMKLDALWSWAIKHWQLSSIPNENKIATDYADQPK